MPCRPALAALLLFAAPSLAMASCPSPDNRTRVSGGEECLVARTFGQPAGGAPVLVVVLHGDVSGGGPARYHFRLAQGVGTNGVVAVGLVRPGYDDGEGGLSTGSNHGRIDSYTPRNVDAVAGAVRALKAHHRARRVVLVGHSGGAAISAVILGKHPGLADAAVLIACPCHIPNMRTGRSPWTRSESPHSYAANVPRNAFVVALSGTADTQVYPALTSGYAASLAARGVGARYVEIAGGDHNGVVWSPEVAQAIREAIAAR